MIKVIFLFLLTFISISAQSFEYLESVGKFNNASSFYITANGLIYISDFGKDEIVMIDSLGKNLKSFGGYGWDENSFDDPSDVFADPLTIYISDKNNHSIKRFDKTLNYLDWPSVVPRVHLNEKGDVKKRVSDWIILLFDCFY